jgi:hypothetical protein
MLEHQVHTLLAMRLVVDGGQLFQPCSGLRSGLVT